MTLGAFYSYGREIQKPSFYNQYQYLTADLKTNRQQFRV